MDKLVLQAVEEIALEGSEGDSAPQNRLDIHLVQTRRHLCHTGCTAYQLWQLLESSLPADVSRLTQAIKCLILAELRKRSDVTVKEPSRAAMAE